MRAVYGHCVALLNNINKDGVFFSCPHTKNKFTHRLHQEKYESLTNINAKCLNQNLKKTLLVFLVLSKATDTPCLFVSVCFYRGLLTPQLNESASYDRPFFNTPLSCQKMNKLAVHRRQHVRLEKKRKTNSY